MTATLLFSANYHLVKNVSLAFFHLMNQPRNSSQITNKGSSSKSRVMTFNIGLCIIDRPIACTAYLATLSSCVIWMNVLPQWTHMSTPTCFKKITQSVSKSIQQKKKKKRNLHGINKVLPHKVLFA